ANPDRRGGRSTHRIDTGENDGVAVLFPKAVQPSGHLVRSDPGYLFPEPSEFFVGGVLPALTTHASRTVVDHLRRLTTAHQVVAIRSMRYRRFGAEEASDGPEPRGPGIMGLRVDRRIDRRVHPHGDLEQIDADLLLEQSAMDHFEVVPRH